MFQTPVADSHFPQRVAVTHIGIIFVDGPGDGALAEGGSEGAAEGGAEGSAQEGVSSESASGAEGTQIYLPHLRTRLSIF